MLIEGADGVTGSANSPWEPLEDVVADAASPPGDAAVSVVTGLLGEECALDEFTLRDEDDGVASSDVCNVGIAVDEGVMVEEDDGWMAIVVSDDCF